MGNSRLVSLTLIPGKVMEQLTLETFSKDMKGRMMIGSSQPGFVKGKSCLTKLIAFSSEAAACQMRGEPWVLLVLSKGFVLSYITSLETRQ